MKTHEIEITPSAIDFGPLHERMQWYVDQNILASCNTLVMKGTDVLDFRTFGYMDVESRRPLTADAIHRMYSNTKIVTSVAAMMLFEAGRFGLDDPVAEYLPEFARPSVLRPGAQSIEDVVPATEPMRMRHLLSHSAGLSYGFIEPGSVIDKAYAAAGLGGAPGSGATLQSLSERLATLPLAFQPGGGWRYSFATDVAARIIEILSGTSFDAFLTRNIFEPLGMHDTAFWVEEQKRERFTTMYMPKNFFAPMQGGLTKADDPMRGAFTQPPTLLSGGGGLVSTMSDYLAFIRMIVAGGSWNGVRILKPETLALMRTNQLAPDVSVKLALWPMPSTVFGLGFALKTAKGAGEPDSAKGEYHWGGMAGTHSWMAPEAGIAGICMTQLMPGFLHPFSHDFKRLAYQLAG
jgi:CubicO group peptidase (beta-lactamase class C family)